MIPNPTLPVRVSGIGTVQPSAYPTVEIALVPTTANTAAVVDATATTDSITQPSSTPSLSVPFVEPGCPPLSYL